MDTKQQDSNESSGNEPPENPYASITLLAVEHTLFAQLTPKNSPHALNARSILEQIQQSEFKHWFIDKAEIEKLIANGECEEAMQLELGEQRDAQASITISKDKMEAYLSIFPSFGGKRLKLEQLTELCKEQGLNTQCIDNKALKEALGDSLNESNKAVEDKIIAHGREPEHGVESQFKTLFTLDASTIPQTDEDGLIDYFATHYYYVVDVDDQLMSRTPATEGKAGINILGQELKAKPGKTLKFAKCSGARVSDDNDNLLIAAQKGHAIEEDKGVRVDNTLELNNADLSSGSIHYDGSVTISGNVFPQISIEVDGDVFVKGSVDNATIIAGKDIVIGGGVISELMPASDKEPPKITTTLQSGGSIYALFLNQTKARAGKNISIQRYAMHCDLDAGENILLGENGGKGILLGGHINANGNIEANVIGSKAYISTNICCAPLEEQSRTLRKLTRTQERRKTEQAQLEIILERIKSQGNPDTIGKLTLDKAKKIHHTLKALQQQLDEIHVELEPLQPQIEQMKSAFVQVNRALYPNTIIDINDRVYHCKKEHKKVTLRVIENTIHFE